MNLDETFPLKLYINLGPAEDRRRRVQNLFLDNALEVERLPAVSKRYVGNSRGHWDKGRYALSLTQKLALREGRRRGASSVLVFEDDVVLHPEWKKRVAALELPNDWGIFYFGCQHLAPPEVVSPGLVRVHNVWDLHAFAVRATWYRKVMCALTPMGKTEGVWLDPSDRAVAKLLKDIPAYAAWPNLAWQAREDSSLAHGWVNDNYTADGLQRRWLDALAGTDREMVKCAAFRAEKVGQRKGRRGTVAFKSYRPLHWQPGAMETTGLGDRMRGLAGMLTFAFFAGRDLRVPWRATALCPGVFSEALEVDGLRVASSDDEWHELTQGLIDHHDDYNVVPDRLWNDLHRGWFLTGGVSLADFEERWRLILRGFRPAKQVLRAVDRLLRGLGREDVLGVHIRRTDALADPSRGHTQRGTVELDADLLSTLRSRWKEKPRKAAVLACDDETTMKAWVSILEAEEIRVIQHTKAWTSTGLRQTTLADAATDLFLLSRCGEVVASIMGSFCWMAAEIGCVPLTIASPSRLAQYEHPGDA